MGAQSSKSPSKRSDGSSEAASNSTSPARSGAASSPSALSASPPGPQASRTQKQQQELDDEAFARRLVMEEIATFGGPSHSSSAGFGEHHGHSQSSPSAQQIARAQCPFCSAQNEFQGAPGGAPVMLQCGGCQQRFQVAMPPGEASSNSSSSTGSSNRMSLQLCRRCGTMNQFPTPAAGQPMPDVLCGACGAVAPASERRRMQRANEARLLEQMLQETQNGGGRMRANVGPMVRVNVGGQRRLVPLALLLALMAEEADKSNPAHQADIAALPTRKLQGNEALGEQMRCTVCLDDFNDGDDVKTLPCLHIYHQKCIEQWLKTDNSCPMCKTPIGQEARRQ